MAGFENELWVTVGANAISATIILIGGFFVLFQNWKRDINRLFFFFTASTALYSIFFIIGILQTTAESAYFWLYLNAFTDVAITVAMVHFIFRVINRQKEWKWFIVLTYGIGIIICIVAILEPSWLMSRVVPKLYFPFYYDGGWGLVVYIVYFLGMVLVATINLIKVFFESAGIERKRLEYFIIMLAVGYGIGCLNFLLVFNIPVDPVYGSLLGLYLIPIAYGIFSTDLLDIRIVVQRALYYAIGITAIATFLITLSFLNGFLVSAIPGFQFWTVPLIVAVFAFSIGRSVLHQARESEKLKYEFITVATHKLRTPLTRIRWLIPELLEKAGDNTELREGIRRIDDANNRLIELTNVLLEASHPGGSYDYEKVPVDMHQLSDDSIKHFATQITEKKLVVTVDEPEAQKALGDTRRIGLVIEVLVENAVMYTPSGGTIQISITKEQRAVRFTIIDTGIGVNREDQENIFSSFYRTNAARTADTEGVGLGLSLAKNIIERQGGRIGVESEGEGKGSTFWFTMPLAPPV